ncbi:MAG TPA: hypothetical protein VMB73_13730, partial [Acetobacteraceae bacterium]|nr:hypothetical protein [Acetobacteraceae bacterium]
NHSMAFAASPAMHDESRTCRGPCPAAQTAAEALTNTGPTFGQRAVAAVDSPSWNTPDNHALIPRPHHLSDFNTFENLRIQSLSHNMVAGATL